MTRLSSLTLQLVPHCRPNGLAAAIALFVYEGMSIFTGGQTIIGGRKIRESKDAIQEWLNLDRLPQSGTCRCILAPNIS
jgi:hypothetical protein